MKIVPGARVAWIRGPSGGRVIGTVVRESPDSPQPSWGRADPKGSTDGAPKRRIFECVQERYSDNWPPAPGAKWNVPECDFVEVPDGL